MCDTAHAPASANRYRARTGPKPRQALVPPAGFFGAWSGKRLKEKLAISTGCLMGFARLRPRRRRRKLRSMPKLIRRDCRESPAPSATRHHCALGRFEARTVAGQRRPRWVFPVHPRSLHDAASCRCGRRARCKPFSVGPPGPAGLSDELPSPGFHMDRNNPLISPAFRAEFGWLFTVRRSRFRE